MKNHAGLSVVLCLHNYHVSEAALRLLRLGALGGNLSWAINKKEVDKKVEDGWNDIECRLFVLQLIQLGAEFNWWNNNQRKTLFNYRPPERVIIKFPIKIDIDFWSRPEPAGAPLVTCKTSIWRFATFGLNYLEFNRQTGRSPFMLAPFDCWANKQTSCEHRRESCRWCAAIIFRCRSTILGKMCELVI